MIDDFTMPAQIIFLGILGFNSLLGIIGRLRPCKKNTGDLTGVM